MEQPMSNKEPMTAEEFLVDKNENDTYWATEYDSLVKGLNAYKDSHTAPLLEEIEILKKEKESHRLHYVDKSIELSEHYAIILRERDEDIERLKADKIQMNLHLQETHAKIEAAFKEGKQQGFEEGWKAYGESL